VETELKDDELVKNCLNLASDIVRFSFERTWVDYDKEADVLYLSFRKPQRASKTIETDDILIRKDGNEIVGITILNASAR